MNLCSCAARLKPCPSRSRISDPSLTSLASVHPERKPLSLRLCFSVVKKSLSNKKGRLAPPSLTTDHCQLAGEAPALTLRSFRPPCQVLFLFGSQAVDLDSHGLQF